MDFEEIGNNVGNWVDLAQDRNYWRSLVNAALDLPVSISHGVSYLINIITRCFGLWLDMFAKFGSLKKWNKGDSWSSRN